MFQVDKTSINIARVTEHDYYASNYSNAFSFFDSTVAGFVACCLIGLMLVCFWWCFVCTDKSKETPINNPVVTHYVSGAAINVPFGSRNEQFLTVTPLFSTEIEGTSETVTVFENESLV